jgi:hypothetical protein
MGLKDDLRILVGMQEGPPDPRKVGKGTSYNAEGSVEPPENADVELGTGKYTPLREVVPELSSRYQAIEQYDRMASNDAAVDVSLRAAKVPVQAATYFVEAFDEKPLNQEIAEFIEYNLMQGLNSPWLGVLDEVLRCYDYGFSLVEPVYELREWAPKRSGANRRRYTMLRKLAPRPATTIKEFLYDNNGGPEGVIQIFLTKDNKRKEVEIPIDKLVVFTINKKGGNIEGKSLLRTAYPHWYYKSNLYKIDAIQKERHGIGVPKYKLQPGYSHEDKKAARTLVRKLRTNEEAGMVLPPLADVEFAKLEGQPVNVMTSIDHHNGMIMMNVMVQFLLMGLQEGGGRATAAAHQNLYEKSLKYVANFICDCFNLYLIPKLVAYNYDTAEFPKLRVRNIGEIKELQMWASALSNLISQNAVTVDYEFEQWVREQIDAPLKKGGKQTPENNSGAIKGGVNTEKDQRGNIGKATDEP